MAKEPTAREADVGADDPAIALAALQTQITDLRRELEDLRERLSVEPAVALEDAVLASADLFNGMTLSVWSYDAREQRKRVADAAKAIRDRRAGRIEGVAA